MKEVYEESIGAFLYNGRIKKFLLLKRINDPFWEFPKGHIEENETHESAIKREIKEETSIREIQILNKIGEISFIINKPDINKKRIIYYYLVKTNEENITLSHEHSDYNLVRL